MYNRAASTSVALRARMWEADQDFTNEVIIGGLKDDRYRNKGIVLPTAFLIFRYNFRTVGIIGTPFREPSYRFDGESDAIILGCSNPEEIHAMSISIQSYDILPLYYPAHANKFKTEELKMPGRMDKVLGEIYSRHPARRTTGEVNWY